MKTYQSIPGPSKAPREHCIAFCKYDGRNIRVEWSKKRGWDKFGSRRRLFDRQDPEYGPVITLFADQFAEGMERIFRDNKDFRGVDKAVAFLEYFGPNTFAGLLVDDDPMELRLLDVNIHKKGILPPSAFLKAFGRLPIAEPVYEGNFNRKFVKDVQEGKYPVKEGVVAKGVNSKAKNQRHALWMAKVKTNWWYETLKKKAEEIESLRQVLAENQQEQQYNFEE